MPIGQIPVTLTAYCRENAPDLDPERRYPAIVVCPGGAYYRLSNRETEPVALRFLADGFQVFVLRYSVAPSTYPSQLIQAAAAVAFIRKHASQFMINPDSVAIMGFSAGGHVAASLGTLFAEPVIEQTLGVTPAQCRPDAMVLCYPVITTGEHAHETSVENITGGKPDPALLQKLALETAVTPETPPAFIWHTWFDSTVPVENALCFATALKRHQVPCELHIFEDGPHGLSLAVAETQTPGRPDYLNAVAARWAAMASEWLKKDLVERS